MKECIVLKGLAKCFGSRVALEEISAELPQGVITGVVGPDGAGKTTLLRLLAGLLDPSQGSIELFSFESFGYMPQRFGLYEELTVLQNMRLYARLKGITEARGQFERLLSFTHLQPFVDRLAGALSGGMKQKLGLACALLGNPSLLLLDEPSVGVDPLSRRELWSMVESLLEEGLSVIWSTTYLDEAERCAHVLLLNEGKLLIQGPPQGITSKMQGRTFLFPTQERRNALFTLIQRPDVVDATLQGEGIRVVLAPEATPFSGLEPISPRFEDGFIDLLGGGPKEPSALAAHLVPLSHDQRAVVEVHALTKQFGAFCAAKDVTFEVHAGEIFGLLGPNGAGKSTTFKMLCGLLRPTSGSASVTQIDLQAAPSEARARIGYMAQKFSLYGKLTVKQNLNLFSGLYNLSGKAQREAIAQMVETFDYASYLDTPAETLPLGFKQRLALSCALMHRPEVLFLDEPTSGVDPITRREFWNHIQGLVEKGITIVVTTHFMDEAEYCDRIALMYQSEVIHLDTPNALKKRAHASTLEEAFIHLIEQHDLQNKN